MINGSRSFFSLERRLISLNRKIRILSSLRKLAGLGKENDITQRQWSIIESQLIATESLLLSRTRSAGRRYLPLIHTQEARRKLNEVLGHTSLELTRALSFFDTFLDILTQRHPAHLGRILAGCDVIAMDAMSNRLHPALSIIEPPLVFLDRGFGASILREGVMMPDGTPCPISLIQIPYEKIQAKYDLTSILHEAGHEVMVRLGLVSVLPRVFKSYLEHEGAPYVLRELFPLWSSEIGPDFFGFCLLGMAASSSIKDILSLPQNHVFRISFTDPHPPPYLRVLLSFELNCYLWGTSGEWRDWANEWLELYPLSGAPTGARRILETARQYLPIIAKALFSTKFNVLQSRTIPSLFNFTNISPWKMRRAIKSAESGRLTLTGFSPSAQLALFRLIRDKGIVNENTLDRLMTTWLLIIGRNREKFLHGIESRSLSLRH